MIKKQQREQLFFFKNLKIIFFAGTEKNKPTVQREKEKCLLRFQIQHCAGRVFLIIDKCIPAPNCIFALPRLC